MTLFSLHSVNAGHSRPMTIRAILLALAFSSTALPALAAGPDSLGADWRQQQGEARAKVKEGQHVPLGQVIEAIRRRTPGRLLDSGIETGDGGRSVYRVRWAAADGRRIDFIADAQTGAILSEER